jgi:hypothetical protein
MIATRLRDTRLIYKKLCGQSTDEVTNEDAEVTEDVEIQRCRNIENCKLMPKKKKLKKLRGFLSRSLLKSISNTTVV